MSKKDYRNELKRILRGYKRFTPQIESDLKRLGIIVGRKKNHVVLYVTNDNGTYPVPISSSGSDKREGLNIVTIIIRIKFYE